MSTQDVPLPPQLIRDGAAPASPSTLLDAAEDNVRAAVARRQTGGTFNEALLLAQTRALIAIGRHLAEIDGSTTTIAANTCKP